MSAVQERSGLDGVTRKRLTEDEREQLLTAYSQGVRRSELADRFGVSISTVGNPVNRFALPPEHNEALPETVNAIIREIAKITDRIRVLGSVSQEARDSLDSFAAMMLGTIEGLETAPGSLSK
jgi:hypothetical protein